MNIRSKQIAATVLALTGVYVGLWAAAWPRQFNDSFPGLGRHWVLALGPYNEHLVRDVGGLYLAMAVVSAWAVVRPRTEVFAMVGLGWLVFNVLHFAYHVRHLDMYDGVDKAGNVVSLLAVIVLAALLLTPSRETLVREPAERKPHANRDRRWHRLDRPTDRRRAPGPW